MRVPVYREQVEKIAPTTEAPRMPGLSMPGVVPGAFGVGAGKAYESLGRVGEQIAAHLYKMELKRQDTERINKETAFMQEWQNILTNQDDETIRVDGQDVTRKKGLLLRQLGQAEGVTLEAKLTYQKLRERYLDKLTKYQYDKLLPFMDRHFLEIEDKLVRHEANQLRGHQEISIENNLKQRILNASTIANSKELGLAVDDAITAAAPFNSQFDEATRKIRNNEIAQKIISSAVDSIGNFQQADALLFQVKDRISPAFYNEKRNELLIKAKKADKQAQLEAVAARNKREEDLFSAHILQGNFTKDMLKGELEAKAISPEFYQAMAHNIESIEKIGAKTSSSAFNKISGDIIDISKKPENIRLELLKKNATGELTDDDLKILNTFNQDITKDVVDKAMPKKTWFQRLFNNAQDKGLRQEIIANMFKQYMQKVNAGEDPAKAAGNVSSVALDNHLTEQLKYPNRQYAANPETKQRIYSDDGGLTWYDEKTGELIK